MKAGFGLLLWTTHVTEAHLPLLDDDQGGGLRRRRGADVRGRGRSTTRWLGERLADAGLAATAVGVMPDAAHNPISADAAERRAGHGASRLAARLRRPRSAPRCCAGRSTSRSAQFTGRGPTEDELGRLAEAHRAMADRAPALTLAVEPLNRFECYVLNTAAQAAAHVARGGPAELRLSLRHLPRQHRGARPGRRRSARRSRRSATSTSRRTTAARRATGTSTTPRRSGRRRRAGYDGWFTIEAFGQALPDLAAATRVWRPLFDSEDEVVTAGARVIRAGWAS